VERQKQASQQPRPPGLENRQKTEATGQRKEAAGQMKK